MIGFEVELGEPMEYPNARRAVVRLGGIAVLDEEVYDTDRTGERTEEQAEKNAMFLVGMRLQRVLAVQQTEVRL